MLYPIPPSCEPGLYRSTAPNGSPRSCAQAPRRHLSPAPGWRSHPTGATQRVMPATIFTIGHGSGSRAAHALDAIARVEGARFIDDVGAQAELPLGDR